MRKVFVDGYNVLNSWPKLRNTMKYSLDVSRQQLIDMLQDYAAFTGYKVYVIFDAHMKKGSLENKEVYSTVEVIYTKEGETADSYIEKTVNDIGRKIEVCVVTSDSLEQQLTFQRGAIRTSSTEFYHQVIEVQKKIKMKTEKVRLERSYKLGDRLDKNVMEELEKIRRNH